MFRAERTVEDLRLERRIEATPTSSDGAFDRSSMCPARIFWTGPSHGTCPVTLS
jgi:hypothetical protein